MNNGRDRQTFAFSAGEAGIMHCVCLHEPEVIGFGGTPMHALMGLLRDSAIAKEAYHNMNAGAKSDLNQEMDYLVTPSNL